MDEELLIEKALLRQKSKEIQIRFTSGVSYALKRFKSDVEIAEAMRRLFKIKEYYERKLLFNYNNKQKLEDLIICFQCYAFDEPCTQCDY